MPYQREADPDANQQAQPYDPCHPSQQGQQPQPPTRRSSQSSQSLLERYSSHGSQEGKEEKSPYSGPGPSVADIEGAGQAGGAGVMQPHIQFMCGPLLNYYSVVNGVWHGAALVVTADKGSILNPPPYLTISLGGASEKIGGQCILTYNDVTQGPCSFWRFMIQIPLQDHEAKVYYSINGGGELSFFVPARGQNMRWVAHSCNGFSGGVNQEEFKGKYDTGFSPLWEDVLVKHSEQPYHCMVGGGDQLYCDAITKEKELQSWINAKSRKDKVNHALTDDMKIAIDRFYFNHYCKSFRSSAFAKANSTIPMVNMLDDHDLIDGFGTYDDETMASPVFSYIGTRGYFWFLAFQLFTVDAIDGQGDGPANHPIPSMLIGEVGPWLQGQRSHSLITYLGPKVAMLLLDCRAERRLTQIVSPKTYQKAFNAIAQLPQSVEQVVIQLGVPIAYPRMSFLEHFLEYKWNPITMLARRNALGLGSFVNKFDQSAELLDDLNDHWCANTHKKERNWLVLEMQRIARTQNVRITFLSGDVHLAAVGKLFTHKRKLRTPVTPEQDHRYMLNVISSAIVNTPPPAGAAKMVSILAGHKHRTLHRKKTDETMLPIFNKDTDGSTLKRPFILARRNYASIDYLDNGALRFDIRVEREQGAGETVSYPCESPPPRYLANKSVTSTSTSPVTPTTGRFANNDDISVVSGAPQSFAPSTNGGSATNLAGLAQAQRREQEKYSSAHAHAQKVDEAFGRGAEPKPVNPHNPAEQAYEHAQPGQSNQQFAQQQQGQYRQPAQQQQYQQPGQYEQQQYAQQSGVPAGQPQQYQQSSYQSAGAYGQDSYAQQGTHAQGYSQNQSYAQPAQYAQPGAQMQNVGALNHAAQGKY
ncbi:hypothetical protein A1Q2_00015 [Trichosporon asahii var. asahii CBS 8904]|uniref:PhoD-like phosphatase domain-containing protein n=1 Tax=Trichosporon asahii var. asahii (strain CBS 8904) TaxID=1220162 RepID=K1VYL3_TRIAC|nr:hypothetical protein A1Q2_00015 [Trichosporon asahii var. asahii CBS 8904]